MRPAHKRWIKSTLRKLWHRLPLRLRMISSTLWYVLTDGQSGERFGRVFLRVNRIMWSKAIPLRTLLTMEPDELSTRQKLAKAMLQVMMRLPDGFYRRRFDRLSTTLLAAKAMRSSGRSQPHGGVLMMIGSLGAGGAERQLVTTAKALHDRGEAHVTVACTNLTSPQERFFLSSLERSGISTFVVGSRGALDVDDEAESMLAAMVDQLPYDLIETHKFLKTITALQPDVAHLWLDDINVKGGIAAVLAGVPRIILSQRSLPPTVFAFHQPYMREAYRWLAKAPNVSMINNSEAGARAYEAWLGLSAGRIGVVHNGFDFEEQELAQYRAGRSSFRERIGIAQNVPLVGAVMRISEEKRPLLWLAVAAAVREAIPAAQFMIVGDGPMRAVAEARANQSDLAGSVHFIGHCSEAMTAIAAMDLMLLTSRVEGLPNVLVEAQFVGVPVVSTRVGGAAEAVDQNRTGLTINGTNPKEFACQIVRLLQDRGWCDAAARQGPMFAEAAFGMQRAIDKTIAVYATKKTEKQALVHWPRKDEPAP